MDLPFPPNALPAMQQPAPAHERERLCRELGAALPAAPAAKADAPEQPRETPFGGVVPSGSFHQGAARAMDGPHTPRPGKDKGKPFTFAF